MITVAFHLQRNSGPKIIHDWENHFVQNTLDTISKLQPDWINLLEGIREATVKQIKLKVLVYVIAVQCRPISDVKDHSTTSLSPCLAPYSQRHNQNTRPEKNKALSSKINYSPYYRVVTLIIFLRSNNRVLWPCLMTRGFRIVEARFSTFLSWQATNVRSICIVAFHKSAISKNKEVSK